MSQKFITLNFGVVREHLGKTTELARARLEKSRSQLVEGARKTGSLALSRIADLGTKASSSQLAMFQQLKRRANVS